MIIINLYGFEFFKEKPKWIEQDIDTSELKYFKGVSRWYENTPNMVELAKKEALSDAYRQISEYFGVKLKSVFTINKANIGGEHYSSVSKDMKLITNQFVSGIKAEKSYVDVDGDYIKVYVLVKIDKNYIDKILNDIERDKKEYEVIKNKLLKAIDNKDYFEAETLLDLAKSKRAATYDDSIKLIENRLKKLTENFIKAVISLNKTDYHPSERMKIKANLNKDGYLYVFFKNKDYILLYPNEDNLNNHLVGDEVIILDKDNIDIKAPNETGKFSIVAVASNDSLAIENYQNQLLENGTYLFHNDNKAFEIIDNCIKQSNCSKTEVVFNVIRPTYPDIEIRIDSSESIKSKIEDFLESNFIVSKDSIYQMRVFIDRKKRYSSMLQREIVFYDTIIRFFKGDELLYKVHFNTSKTRLPLKIKEHYINFTKRIER